MWSCVDSRTIVRGVLDAVGWGRGWWWVEEGVTCEVAGAVATLEEKILTAVAPDVVDEQEGRKRCSILLR